MNKLTAKQIRFVSEYMVDLNATQAAIRAGYSKRSANVNGPRMLVNAGIAKAIAEANAVVAKRNDLTVDDVIETAKEVLGRCMELAQVYDKEGAEVKGVCIFDATNALKANDQLARIIGAYAPERHNVTTTHESSLAEMGDLDSWNNDVEQ